MEAALCAWGPALKLRGMHDTCVQKRCFKPAFTGMRSRPALTKLTLPSCPTCMQPMHPVFPTSSEK